ncbi:glycosyltransferase family 61 protein [Paenibacillus solani]|uniref:glycosyltransferase family 61 protein n=1 Tax=Paenibacillus solani TaxID=1705565 RepID=UPI0009EBA8D3|nr:glycosyltransferase family 61 protein [Paenibacillus solani]
MLLPKRDTSVITPERFYISRKKASVRRIINENEVIHCLEAHGFVSLCLEDWTVAQQIKMFASAKAIVGQHGAGMSNLAFCTPGTRVIEIFHIHHVVPTYWMISNHNDLNYYMLYGQMPESTSVNFPGLEDYFVDTAFRANPSLSRVELGWCISLAKASGVQWLGALLRISKDGTLDG